MTVVDDEDATKRNELSISQKQRLLSQVWRNISHLINVGSINIHFKQPEEDRPLWIPFVLTTPALVCMLLFAVAIFVALEVAFHTITSVHPDAAVDLTTSHPPCQLTLSDVSIDDQGYNEIQEYPCPSNSTFGQWGGYCCCANCTATEAPYPFTNWSNIPDLPPGSEHASGELISYTKSTIWFLISFGPIIVAIVFSLLWNSVDVNVKKLHPFMEMAHPNRSHQVNGRSICFTYLDKNTFLVPFYALWHLHTRVFVASCLDVASCALVPLLAASFELQIFVLSVDGGLLFGRSPALNQTVARITQAFLVCMILGIAYLTYLLRRKQSAVYSDPTSIATIITMAHPTVLAAFRSLDTGTSVKLTSAELDRRLQSLRPRLRHIVDEATGRSTYQMCHKCDRRTSVQL